MAHIAEAVERLRKAHEEEVERSLMKLFPEEPVMLFSVRNPATERRRQKNSVRGRPVTSSKDSYTPENMHRIHRYKDVPRSVSANFPFPATKPQVPKSGKGASSQQTPSSNPTRRTVMPSNSNEYENINKRIYAIDAYSERKFNTILRNPPETKKYDASQREDIFDRLEHMGNVDLVELYAASKRRYPVSKRHSVG